MTLSKTNARRFFGKNHKENDENNLKILCYRMGTTQNMLKGGKADRYLNGYKMYLIRYKKDEWCWNNGDAENGIVGIDGIGEQKLLSPRLD
jgi:hypothetical protein